MKNTHCQPAALVSSPPRITPSATPEPPTAAQTPSALFRAAPVNMVETSDSAAGDSSAAPAPCATRPPISIAPLTASPLIADAAVKITRPVTSTRRAPNWSASRPPSSIIPPNTIV
jgi:hypothetical protein